MMEIALMVNGDAVRATVDQVCIFSCGPYRVPNVRIEGIAVFTNNANGGAFRGYGINQAAVAIEQLLDELALKLGMDPFEIRRINMLREGDTTITGQYLPSSVGALPTLDACKKVFEEDGFATAVSPCCLYAPA